MSTIDATLSPAPGFFRLTTDLFLDVSRFPDNSVTLLEQPGCDTLGRFDGGHASKSQLQAWASGQLSSTLMVVSPDFRLPRSSPPNPWKPPHFDLSRLDMTITGTPTGPVDLAHAPMALLAAVHDGSGKDANAGLALFARCGALTLDGQIVTSARYGQAYTSTFASPDIDQGADAATLELPNFSGKVCLQKRPGHLLFDGLIAAAGIVGSALAFSWLIGVVGSYAIIELVMLDILEHSSPVRVDDLCSGSYFLTPRPSTELYVFEFVTNGWRHDTEPYNWDLKIPRTALPPLIIAWLLEELGDTFF